MRIKETTYTKYDAKGRPVKQIRRVEVIEPTLDEGYDFGTRYCGCGMPRRSSFDRIMESYMDYRASEEW